MQFSIGDVLAIVDKTILNPLVVSAGLLSLHFLTNDKYAITANDGLFPYRISTPDSHRKALFALGFGLLLRANRYMTRKALNNNTAAQFDWDREIIVVTGGSGGIGAQAAQKLAERGSKVIVIDVLPLTFDKREFYNVYHEVCHADMI